MSLCHALSGFPGTMKTNKIKDMSLYIADYTDTGGRFYAIP